MLKSLLLKLARGIIAWADPAADKPVAYLARINEEQFKVLQRNLPNTAVTSNTTETQAAYQLGVAHTVSVLREGWVVQ